MSIEGKELVEKRNILNELRKNSMSLQELRLFSIYLSKINSRDIKSRKVSVAIEDFQEIMKIGRVNIQHLQFTTNRLLSKVVNIKNPKGGYDAFQLFKRCRVFKDDFDKWYIEIDAHDDALPLMFDFKREYFTYELWNALKLKSCNQLRVYELLKQYEKTGERRVTLQEFRELLGIKPNEYPRWNNFKVRVLDSCQQALLENTDIKFTYQPIRSGRGGKISGIHFFIKKNENYTDQLNLSEFIELKRRLDLDEKGVDFQERRTEICQGFDDPIFDEFTEAQLVELRALAWNKVDLEDIERENNQLGDICAAKEFVVYEYVKRKVLMCNAQGDNIRNRYKYIKCAVDKNYE